MTGGGQRKLVRPETQCGAIMPGTDKNDIDASVPEITCMQVAGHEPPHSSLVTWPSAPLAHMFV